MEKREHQAAEEDKAARNQELLKLYRNNILRDFKNHQFPMARIKKIMKANRDVKMVSAEAPALVAKACELFILDLTYNSWLNAEMQSSRTIQKNDIVQTVLNQSDIYDFLDGVIPQLSAGNSGAGPSDAGNSGASGSNGQE